METQSKIKLSKIVIIASIISAILLAITAVIPSVADSIKSNTNGEDVGVTATKTAQWTDEDFTKGNVQITAKATGKDEYIPNVLFIGTLCNAHGLTNETIVHSLNAIKEFCDVDYFLCHNADPSRTDLDAKGSIKKGDPDVSTDIVPEMVVSDHQALQKFLRHIYEEHNNMVQKTGKGYDFIVLEFDGTRISDWYRSLIPDGDTDSRRPSGDYTKYVNEDSVVDILKSYYANNRVIWITDNEVDVTDPNTGYHPSTAMNVRTQNLDTRPINYNSLKGLLAPDLYVSTTEHAGMTDEEYRKIEANLSTDPFDADHTLKFDRQIGYKSSSAVGGFLKDAIDSIFEYQIVIKDKIDLKDNLKITTDSVVFEMREKDGDDWTVVPASMKPVVTVDFKTGEVNASVAKLRGDKQFRVTIGFEDKSSTERFIDVSKDGNPNDGNAEVEVIPGTGVTPEPATPGTEIPLDWDIPIYYVVEDAYKETEGIKVTNPEDNITTSSKSVPKGSEATETSTIKFQYWSTVIDGKDTFVSNDFYYKPQPDQATNRYKSATYIAHFAESPAETKYLTVKKVWSDGDDFHLDDTINVRLHVKNSTGKEAVLEDSIKIDASTKWTYKTKFEYQVYEADRKTPLQYYFTEDPIEGYQTTYEVVTDATKPFEIGNTVITNTYVEPPTPPGPTPDPPTPTPTPDPGNVTPVGYGSVKTGDIVNLVSLLIFAVVGSASIAVITRVRKKNKERG